MVAPTTKSSQLRRWHLFPDQESLEQAAARAILLAARDAVAQRDAFHIVLAGGNTPRNIYRQLATATSQWDKWHIYFGDERCLPPSHAERNSLMARQAWLDHSPIPRDQIHIIPAESGADVAAAEYCKSLSEVITFDLVLLGLGEDGHTASLFPAQDWGTEDYAPAAIAVHNSPKPPSDRVSLSARRLGQSLQVIFLASGAAKHQALSDWQSGKPIPAATILPVNGVDIFSDQLQATTNR